MAFPRQLLNEGEELVLDLRPHWLYLAPATLALAGSVILGILALVKLDSSGFENVLRILAGVLVLACLVWFGLRYVKWTTTNFVLTGDRIVTRRGVLSKQGVEIPLDRINTVFFHQAIFERMVGAGDLTIESAGERGSETFEDIRKPSIVQKEIYVQMENNENRKYDRMHARAPQAPSAGPGGAPGDDPTRAFGSTGGHLSVPEQIEKLDELRQRGVLSDEEFAAKKAELLDRM